MTKSQLLPQILELPIEERLALMEDIRQSLDEHSSLTPAQIIDLEDRLKDLDAHPDAGDTWENVLARLRDRQ